MLPQYTDDMTPDALLDYLTCGGCAREFPLQNITNFIQHKQVDCKDGSQPQDSNHSSNHGDTTAPSSQFGNHGNYRRWEITQIGVTQSLLSCVTCAKDFLTARGLLHHVQLNHNLEIFFKRSFFKVHEPRPAEACRSPENQSGAVRCNKGLQPKNAKAEASGCLTTVAIDDDDDAMERNLSPTRRHLAGTMICCNTKDCCVTIEQVKTCCSSVVPKKRIQHMKEHSVSHDDEGGNSEQMEQEEDKENSQVVFTNDNDSIIIDIQACSSDGNRQNEEKNEEEVGNDSCQSPDAEQDNSDQDGSTSQTETEEPFDKQTSVITHPSLTASIPRSQTFPTSSLSSAVSRAHETGTPSRKIQLVTYTLTPQATLPGGPSPTASSDQSQAGPGHHLQDNDPIANQKQRGGASGSDARYGRRAASPDTSEMEEHRLTIDMDIGHQDDDGNEDDWLADRGSNRKRRYPTSRPYKCDKCENAFNQRIHLKKHYFKHTGIKPFKCQECDYSTVERSHLKVHIRIHTGEKPFKCMFCTYATAQNSTLKIHLKRHHGGQMWKCQMCNKKFTQKNLLQCHQDEHLGSHGVGQPIENTLGSSRPQLNQTGNDRSPEVMSNSSPHPGPNDNHSEPSSSHGTTADQS